MEKELFKARNRQTGRVITGIWSVVSELDKRIWDVVPANGNEPVWFKPKKATTRLQVPRKLLYGTDKDPELDKAWDARKVFERTKDIPFQYLNESIAKYYTWNCSEKIRWLKAA